MSEEMESLWFAMRESHYKRTIERIAGRVRETRSPEAALQAALEEVVAAVHAQAGTFWLFERSRDGRIRPRARCGGADISGISLLPGEGIAGRVIGSGKSVIITDCGSDPGWAGRVDGETGFQTRSMICVPLSAEGQVFGSIQIVNKTDGLLYDEKDLAFAEKLADEISGILERQRALDGYVSRAGTPREDEGPPFLEVMFARSEREMEYMLRGIRAYSALRASDQKEALRLIKGARAVFAKVKDEYGS